MINEELLCELKALRRELCELNAHLRRGATLRDNLRFGAAQNKQWRGLTTKDGK